MMILLIVDDPKQDKANNFMIRIGNIIQKNEWLHVVWEEQCGLKVMSGFSFHSGFRKKLCATV